MRFLHLSVIVLLVAAAAYVYEIKFESTLRAEWSKLDTPARIQELAKRHLTTLKPIDPRQFDTLRNLPERPPDLVPPDAADPIGSLLENPEVLEMPTSSISSASPAKR